ncbi:MAG: CoA pyrophosphatase [Chloroflexi bacterium HGW-Chloroflexi-10]|nr:MAG: CoA pyrophosphatase [Chloroflexi bacterium HGW-Chloroflexi-10]
MLDYIEIQKKLIPVVNGSFEYPQFIEQGFRRAAVLVAFVQDQNEWSLLYTRRSENLSNHRGQVSFPGGAMDPSDQTPMITALREAKEEIGINSNNIQILGSMSEFLTNSNYLVTPVVAIMDWPSELQISYAEVSRVFTIPIEWLRKKKNWEEKSYTQPGGMNGSVIFFQPYDGELLWGISARITVDLLNLLE